MKSSTHSILLAWFLAATGIVLNGLPAGGASWLQDATAIWKIPPQDTPAALTTHTRDIRTHLPMMFEERREAGIGAAYVARGSGYSVRLHDGNAQITLARDAGKMGNNAGRATLTMRLLDANPDAKAQPDREHTATAGYFIGNDPAAWRNGIPIAPHVRYEEVYRATDLVYYGNARELEFDFIVRPGGDPSRINFALEGATGLRLLASGDLCAIVNGREVQWRKPYVYQRTPAGERAIPASYRLTGDSSVAFEVATYDPALPLVIDPVISYATYLGGSLNDRCSGIAVDADGNAYVTGLTGSDDFPTTPGAVEQRAHRTIFFVTKLDPTGTRIIWSTYIGSVNEPASADLFDPAIAIDSARNVYLAGAVNATDYPVVNALQGTSGGSTDAVITKIDPTGTSLLYSTYLGGADIDVARTIAVGRDNSVVVGGVTFSEDDPATSGRNESFPLMRALQTDMNGDGRYIPPPAAPTDPTQHSDGFLAKLSPAGDVLAFSTYIGGGNDELLQAVALDVTGAVYFTGATGSADFPVTPGALQSTPTPGPFPLPVWFDGFAAKAPADGSVLTYATYLGDNSPAETGWDIAVDTAGSAYVARLQATLFSTSALVSVITKLSPDGGTALYATNIGMNVNGIAVQTDGVLYTAFSTTSAGYVIRLRADGSRGGQIVVQGTSLLDIATNDFDTVYASGFAPNGVTTFPTTPGVVGPQPRGRIEGTVMKIGFEREEVDVTLVAPIDSAEAGDTVWLPIVLRDGARLPRSVTGFTANIRVEASVLYPLSPLAVGTVEGNERVIPIELARPAAGDSVVGRLPFIVMLGLTDTSQLILEEALAVGGGARVQTIPGRLTVGICREGGPRLFDGAAIIGMKTVVPTPARSSAVLEFSLADAATVRVDLIDMAGRLAATLVNEPMQAGTHMVAIDVQGLPAGQYSAVLRAARQIARTPLIIQH